MFYHKAKSHRRETWLQFHQLPIVAREPDKRCLSHDMLGQDDIAFLNDVIDVVETTPKSIITYM